MDRKPKLALAPPLPNVTLDVGQSRTWHDGSALHVTSKGILLVEAQARYSAKPCSTILSLVKPASLPDKK